ncbi:FUSC family protein [Romboutsia sedimentorum]|uniref:FUSC family protein n=1 Tax=Romboutsia sedimentorum TaxID=1368474 RepID=UPI0024DEE40A|nr:FUSC family protein [Romboutsia sedimentorum]MDK2584785.1 FUSC family protein [Romboutsia sedimentorum]
MKKLILSKTIMFIFIIGFINTFITLFSSQNTLIGVTVITAALMLLERDLTISPLKNTLKLLGVNILLGVLSFFAAKNILLGLILNFIAIFIVGYLFNYDLKKPMYVGFGLQYLFMLSTPVTNTQLPLRIASLAFGAIFIMIVQFIVNKDKLEKNSKKILKRTCDELLIKVDNLQSSLSNEKVNLKIEENINNLKKLVYDNRKDDFCLSDKGISILNIGISLDRISLILDSYIKQNEDNTNLLYTNDAYNKDKPLSIIKSQITNLKACLDKDQKIENKFSEKYTQDIYLYEFYNELENIYKHLDEYKKCMIYKNKKAYKYNLEVPDKFKTISVYKRNLNKDSLKFSYAFKVALATSIAGFIMDYFKLTEGRWIMFTTFALVQPYSENCIVKFKKRIQGTLLGAMLAFILFSTIKDESIRGIVIIIAGYASTYTKDYRGLLICNTISAIGAVALIGNIGSLFINRILYVALGSVIALLINKFVLHYNVEKGSKYLLDMYDSVNKEIITEVSLYLENKNNSYKIKNLVLIPVLIEEKLLQLNETYKDDKLECFIKKQKHLTNNLYSLYINIKENNIKENEVEKILKDIDYVFKDENHQKAKDKILEEIYYSEDLRNKIVYKNLLYSLNILNKKNEEILA